MKKIKNQLDSKIIRIVGLFLILGLIIGLAFLYFPRNEKQKLADRDPQGRRPPFQQGSFDSLGNGDVPLRHPMRPNLPPTSPQAANPGQLPPDQFQPNAEIQRRGPAEQMFAQALPQCGAELKETCLAGKMEVQCVLQTLQKFHPVCRMFFRQAQSILGTENSHCIPELMQQCPERPRGRRMLESCIMKAKGLLSADCQKRLAAIQLKSGWPR